jgi:hypothetical protein
VYKSHSARNETKRRTILFNGVSNHISQQSQYSTMWLLQLKISRQSNCGVPFYRQQCLDLNVTDSALLDVALCKGAISGETVLTTSHTANKQNKQTPWPESASELYQPSNYRLSAKLGPTSSHTDLHKSNHLREVASIPGTSNSNRTEARRIIMKCMEGRKSFSAM